MDNVFLAQLARENSAMADVDRLVNLFHLLSQTLYFGVPGTVVELGCHAGLTSVLFQKVIDALDPSRALHVYDSFLGLPTPTAFDDYLAEGDCRASELDVLRNCARWQVRAPMIHRGWFRDTLPSELPDAIAFAYIDADFYDSTRVALTHVYPRLSPSAIICIDDYADQRNPAAWRGLPGVRKAVDEFVSCGLERPSVLVGSGDLAFCYIRANRDPIASRHDESQQFLCDSLDHR